MPVPLLSWEGKYGVLWWVSYLTNQKRTYTLVQLNPRHDAVLSTITAGLPSLTLINLGS